MKTAVSYPFLGKQQRLAEAFSKDVCGWFGLSNSSSVGELKAAGSSIQKPFFKALLTEHWHSCDSCNAVINNLLSRTGSFWHGFCFVPVPISPDKKIRPYQLLRCTQQLSCNCDLILPQWVSFQFTCALQSLNSRWYQCCSCHTEVGGLGVGSCDVQYR